MELQNLQDLADKAAKLSIQESTKTQRELSNLRKSLVQERHLKLDAFHLVDDLQGQIYDLETLENMNFKSQSELSKSNWSAKLKFLYWFSYIFVLNQKMKAAQRI